jgi:hypothetical protein
MPDDALDAAITAKSHEPSNRCRMVVSLVSHYTALVQYNTARPPALRPLQPSQSAETRSCTVPQSKRRRAGGGAPWAPARPAAPPGRQATETNSALRSRGAEPRPGPVQRSAPLLRRGSPRNEFRARLPHHWSRSSQAKPRCQPSECSCRGTSSTLAAPWPKHWRPPPSGGGPRRRSRKPPGPGPLQRCKHTAAAPHHTLALTKSRKHSTRRHRRAQAACPQQPEGLQRGFAFMLLVTTGGPAHPLRNKIAHTSSPAPWPSHKQPGEIGAPPSGPLPPHTAPRTALQPRAPAAAAPRRLTPRASKESRASPRCSPRVQRAQHYPPAPPGAAQRRRPLDRARHRARAPLLRRPRRRPVLATSPCAYATAAASAGVPLVSAGCSWL